MSKLRLNRLVMLVVILTESRLATLEFWRLTVNRLALPGEIIKMVIRHIQKNNQS